MVTWNQGLKKEFITNPNTLINGKLSDVITLHPMLSDVITLPPKKTTPPKPQHNTLYISERES